MNISRVGASLLLLVLTELVRGDEASAVAELEKLGASIKRDESKPGKSVIDVSLMGSKVTDGSLAHLKELKNLQKLDLVFCTTVTDAGLDHLKELKSLQSLSLYGSTGVTDAGLIYLKDLENLQTLNLNACPKVTDAGLAHLKELKNLQTLKLVFCKVTAAGLAHLKGLKNLQTLDLAACNNVADAGLAQLKEFKNLQTLNLGNCKGVTDAGLAHFKELMSLRSLALYETAVTDAGLAHLKELKNIQALYLRGTAVSDAGLAHLKDFKALQKLDLVFCTGVTDSGLEHLKELKSLRSLDLTRTSVTNVGLAELKKVLPKCEISCISPVPFVQMPVVENNEAAQLFRQMEAKLTKAKTLECAYENKYETSKGTLSRKGTIFLGDGNKIRLEMSTEFEGKVQSKALLISDGIKMAVGSEGTDKTILDAPKQFGELCRLALPRFYVHEGFFMFIIHDEKFRFRDEFQVTEFKMGKKEMVGKQEAQVIQYRLTLKTLVGSPATVSLWVDTKTGLPLRRVVVAGIDDKKETLTETYTKIVTDEKIDPKLFELPKN